MRSNSLVTSFRRAIASRARFWAAVERLLAITATIRNASKATQFSGSAIRRCRPGAEKEVQRQHRRKRHSDRDAKTTKRRGPEHDQQEHQRRGRRAELWNGAQHHREDGDDGQARDTDTDVLPCARREHDCCHSATARPSDDDLRARSLRTLYVLLTIGAVTVHGEGATCIRITCVPGAAVSRGELGRVLADYLTLDQVRAVRRLLVVRCGALAFAAAVIGAAVPGCSWAARAGSVALIAIVPVWAWIIELRMERRLSRALDVDGGMTERIDTRERVKVDLFSPKVVKST